LISAVENLNVITKKTDRAVKGLWYIRRSAEHAVGWCTSTQVPLCIYQSPAVPAFHHTVLLSVYHSKHTYHLYYHSITGTGTWVQQAT